MEVVEPPSELEVSNAAPPVELPVTVEPAVEARRPVSPRPADEFLEVVYFEFDHSVIRADQIERIDRNLQYLIAHPEAEVLIEGHCDARGTNEYNFALGERRAGAIMDYFVRNGIDPKRIVTLSWGEERPAVPGEGEEAWVMNRRCQFLFIH